MGQKAVYYQLLLMFPDVASACLGVLLPALLVRGLEEKWEIMPLLFAVLLLAFGIWGFEMLRESMLLLFILILNMMVSFALLSLVRKKHEEYHKNLGTFTARASYISRQSMEKRTGKEIRIYQMMDWLMQKYQECLKGIDGIYGHLLYRLAGAASGLRNLCFI